MRRGWVIAFAYLFVASCDPPKPCNLKKVACGADPGSHCDVESLDVAFDKIDALATLACNKSDFWVECANTLEAQARQRDQRGCDGERATNRLVALRRIAGFTCISTTEHWDSCYADMRKTVDSVAH